MHADGTRGRTPNGPGFLKPRAEGAPKAPAPHCITPCRRPRAPPERERGQGPL